MASHPNASFKSLSEAEDGELALARLADGSYRPGIKGSRDGHPFLMILSEKVTLPDGQATSGPFLLFGDEAFLVFGKDFIVHYEPSPTNIRIHDSGNPELGSLVVVGDRTCVVAHSPAGIGLVDIDSAEELRPQVPSVVIKKWALGLRGADDTITWMFERT